MDGTGSSSLFSVTVDFDKSHMFFPTIVIWFLVFLLILIAIIYGIPYLKAVSKGDKKISFSTAHIDKLRLLGTLFLTIVYFMSMDFVGGFFPNTGLGFLFMSMPFMFLLSLLYSHELNRGKLITIVLNAVISPSVAWYVLANIFNITLP